MTILKINGAPVAVVPRLPTPEMTTAWRKSGEHWQRPTADMDWCSMLAASDPALTAAVVEMREALFEYVKTQGRMLAKWDDGDENVKRDLWRDLHACGENARAALARVEVSR